MHVKPLFKLLVRVVPVTPIIAQMMAVALGGLSKVEGKLLLLKTLHS